MMHHDTIILEEAPQKGFEEMLAGRISIDSYRFHLRDCLRAEAIASIVAGSGDFYIKAVGSLSIVTGIEKQAADILSRCGRLYNVHLYKLY